MTRRYTENLEIIFNPETPRNPIEVMIELPYLPNMDRAMIKEFP
jgi:hypothetical protein